MNKIKKCQYKLLTEQSEKNLNFSKNNFSQYLSRKASSVKKKLPDLSFQTIDENIEYTRIESADSWKSPTRKRK